MLEERGDRFAILGQRMRRKTEFCLLIDRVDHLSRRQNAAEVIGDLLCGLRRHRHADEVVVAADGQVIGHDLERCRDVAFHTAVSSRSLPRIGTVFELAEKLGEIAAGDFAQDRRLHVPRGLLFQRSR